MPVFKLEDECTNRENEQKFGEFSDKVEETCEEEENHPDLGIEYFSE